MINSNICLPLFLHSGSKYHNLTMLILEYEWSSRVGNLAVAIVGYTNNLMMQSLVVVTIPLFGYKPLKQKNLSITQCQKFIKKAPPPL